MEWQCWCRGAPIDERRLHPASVNMCPDCGAKRPLEPEPVVERITESLDDLLREDEPKGVVMPTFAAWRAAVNRGAIEPSVADAIAALEADVALARARDATFDLRVLYGLLDRFRGVT